MPVENRVCLATSETRFCRKSVEGLPFPAATGFVASLAWYKLLLLFDLVFAKVVELGFDAGVVALTIGFAADEIREADEVVEAVLTFTDEIGAVLGLKNQINVFSFYSINCFDYEVFLNVIYNNDYLLNLYQNN